MATEFEKSLEQLINTHSMENGSNTPDFILAQFLSAALNAFDVAASRRSNWYGIGESPGSNVQPIDLAPREPMTLNDMTPGLVDTLRHFFAEYGPAGVQHAVHLLMSEYISSGSTGEPVYIVQVRPAKKGDIILDRYDPDTDLPIWPTAANDHSYSSVIIIGVLGHQ